MRDKYDFSTMKGRKDPYAKRLKQSVTMDYEIRIQDVAPHTLAAVRDQATLAELAEAIPRLLDQVYAFLKSSDITQDGHNVVVYAGDEGRIECGVEVASAFEGNGKVVCSSTLAGRVATTMHWGPYKQISQAHVAVRAWCDEQGLVPAGPHWEVYGDWDDDPAKLRAEVLYLLQDE